jgi:SAM-dependent methyltransferase
MQRWCTAGRDLDAARSYGQVVADAVFEHPRLASVYDALEPDRGDLRLYVDLLQEVDARSVLDVGCGTGTFAVLLADRGLEVTGVDPAAASLAVARSKPGADRVRWLCGDATSLPPLQVDAATMTANVAAGDRRPPRTGTPACVRSARRCARAGTCSSRAGTRRTAPGSSGPALRRTACRRSRASAPVESWTEVVAVGEPLVTIRTTWVFRADGAVLTSDSTLRFRGQDELVAALLAHGFAVDAVRSAPDRFGRELVLLARRPGSADDRP